MDCTKNETCEVPNCPGPHPVVSDPDEKLDRLVQRASRPTLAELYKKGRAKGLIPAQNHYH
jgi:hypothetical protein